MHFFLYYLFILFLSNNVESVTEDDVLSKVSLWRGDITHLEIDAIVNAGKILKNSFLVYFVTSSQAKIRTYLCK